MSTAPSPQVQRFGEAVLLHGRALTLIAHLAAAGAEVITRRDGYLSPSTQHLLNTLAGADEDARRSAPGHLDVRTEAKVETSFVVEMDAAAVARELGVTDRHVRRLARDGQLSGHRSGRGWSFTKAEVEFYMEQRKATR